MDDFRIPQQHVLPLIGEVPSGFRLSSKKLDSNALDVLTMQEQRTTLDR